MAHVEHIVKEKTDALQESKSLKDDDEGHRDLVDHLDATHADLVQIDRLGKSVATALLAARARRPELIEAEVRHGRQQEDLRIVDDDVTTLPAYPRFLNDVFGADHVTHHSISEHEQ